MPRTRSPAVPRRYVPSPARASTEGPGRPPRAGQSVNAKDHHQDTGVGYVAEYSYIGDKAAPLRGTASGAPRAGLCLGSPARHARAGSSRAMPPDLAGRFVMHPGAVGQPSSSACQCPGHGRRVKGAFGVARDRFATHDPPTVSQRFGAYGEDGGSAGIVPYSASSVASQNDLPRRWPQTRRPLKSTRPRAARVDARPSAESA
jgi:hypothetical protein